MVTVLKQQHRSKKYKSQSTVPVCSNYFQTETKQDTAQQQNNEATRDLRQQETSGKATRDLRQRKTSGKATWDLRQQET